MSDVPVYWKLNEGKGSFIQCTEAAAKQFLSVEGEAQLETKKPGKFFQCSHRGAPESGPQSSDRLFSRLFGGAKQKTPASLEAMHKCSSICPRTVNAKKKE